MANVGDKIPAHGIQQTAFADIMEHHDCTDRASINIMEGTGIDLKAQLDIWVFTAVEGCGFVDVFAATKYTGENGIYFRVAT